MRFNILLSTFIFTAIALPTVKLDRRQTPDQYLGAALAGQSPSEAKNHNHLTDHIPFLKKSSGGGHGGHGGHGGEGSAGGMNSMKMASSSMGGGGMGGMGGMGNLLKMVTGMFGNGGGFGKYLGM